VKLIIRAARDVLREMWERMQKLLLEERFSATIPQVSKFSLLFRSYNYSPNQIKASQEQISHPLIF
jgi:hypothetical protein